MDEWVAGDGRGFNTTLGIAVALHEFFRHSDYVMMGGYTGFNGLYVYDDTDAVISSIGLLFQLYKNHHAEFPVMITGNSPQKELMGTIGVDVPKEVSGSSTYPLDVVATVNRDKTKMVVSVVNPTYIEQQLILNYEGRKADKHAERYALIPKIITDENSVVAPDLIQIKEDRINLKPKQDIPPHSIVLYEIDLK